MAKEAGLTSDEAAIVAKALELSDRFERQAVGELRASIDPIPEPQIGSESHAGTRVNPASRLLSQTSRAGVG
jgi:hypothetical protein